MNHANHRDAPYEVPKPRHIPVLTAPSLVELQRLTIKEVCALVGRSETSVRDLIAAGRFPQPDYRDGPRCVRWSAGLVRRWLEATTVQGTK